MKLVKERQGRGAAGEGGAPGDDDAPGPSYRPHVRVEKLAGAIKSGGWVERVGERGGWGQARMGGRSRGASRPPTHPPTHHTHPTPPPSLLLPAADMQNLRLEELNLLDFLAYCPLFLGMHDSIVRNPFDVRVE